MRNLLTALLLAGCMGGQTVSDLLTHKLHQRIEAYAEKMDGVLGVAIVDLTTGEQWSYHGKAVFAQASVIKIPILIEVYRLREAGKIRFEDKVTLEVRELVGGSGVLQTRLKNGPITVTIEEIVREMIASSDNTATNWLIRKVGMQAVNETMRGLGFTGTKLQRIMLDQAAASRDEENVSTPEEMARMVRLIYDGKAVSPAASAGMLDMMKLVQAAFRRAVAADVEVASKVGDLTGVRTEVGIVYLKKRPYILSVMSTYLKEPFSPVEEVARMVFEHFKLLDLGNAYGNLGVR